MFDFKNYLKKCLAKRELTRGSNLQCDNQFINHPEQNCHCEFVLESHTREMHTFNASATLKQVQGDAYCRAEFISAPHLHGTPAFNNKDCHSELVSESLTWSVNKRSRNKFGMTHNKTKHCAFSLVEIMLSLIIISLITAAFAPVISKKLSRSTIVAGGSGGGASVSEITNDCNQNNSDGTYSFGENCTLCVKDYCLTCDLSCSDGYYKNTKKCVCASCSSTCNTCVSDTKCTDCKTGNYFKNDKCNPYTVQNCATYASDEDKCETCKTGYYLNSSSGICNSYTVTNCSTYNPSSDACTVCKSGYYLSSGKCIAYTVTNCSAYSSTADQCTSCKSGYYLTTDKKCLSCSSKHGSNCSGCTESKCTDCSSGYYLSGGSCYSCSSRFNSYCTSCSSSTCYTCTRNCGSGYYETSSCGCSSCSSNCTSCSSSSYCYSCSSGYKVSGGSCVKSCTSPTDVYGDGVWCTCGGNNIACSQRPSCCEDW